MTSRKVVPEFEGLPVLFFAAPKEWKRWLHRFHAKSTGVWLHFFKKGTGIESLDHGTALDEALCYGWIDSQARRWDDRSYLQKFSPRRARSKWSKINRDHVARLTRDKRMQPAGLREVERAKADGRWDAAYDSPKNATIPPDFKKAMARNRKAQAFFATLNGQNVYAICFRLQTAKKPETRARRIEKFVEMLAEGKKFY
jgi:uncharacterized protein YdeI (YjbR/CyaY-like superfamily)